MPLTLAFLLCCFAAGLAAAQDRPKLTVPDQFVEETHVIAPRLVGKFVLEEIRFDPQRKRDGVSVRYRHPDHPRIGIDLSMHPIGEIETETVLYRGMLDFRAAIQDAVKNGVQRNVIESETEEFDITAPLTAFDRKNEAALMAMDASKDAELKSLGLRLSTSNRHIDGQRLDVRFDLKGRRPKGWWPMRSRTYLFHRQLHVFTGVISAETARIDDRAYSELADRAMRELVPAVQTYNVGQCGNIPLDVPGDVPPDKLLEAATAQLWKLNAHIRRRNCHFEVDDAELKKLSEGAAVEVIRYAPAEWDSLR